MLAAALRKHQFDFVQVNYSIDDREAADLVLPVAQERGVAVLINVPFGGRRRSLFRRVVGKGLPPLAVEVGARSWAQFFLKYSISHPAVTCRHSWHDPGETSGGQYSGRPGQTGEPGAAQGDGSLLGLPRRLRLYTGVRPGRRCLSGRGVRGVGGRVDWRKSWVIYAHAQIEMSRLTLMPLVIGNRRCASRSFCSAVSRGVD